MSNLYLIFLKLYYPRKNLKKIETLQIDNSDKARLWDVADNFINYCSNDSNNITRCNWEY